MWCWSISSEKVFCIEGLANAQMWWECGGVAWCPADSAVFWHDLVELSPDGNPPYYLARRVLESEGNKAWEML